MLIRISLPCSTTQMPMCARLAQFITMDSPDQVPLLAAAGLPGPHPGALMTHLGVLGPFQIP
jgi:hypothetical protein